MHVPLTRDHPVTCARRVTVPQSGAVLSALAHPSRRALLDALHDHDGSIAAEGRIITAVPNERLEMTFSPTWDDAVTDEEGFRIVWSLEDQGDSTLVTVEHHELDPATETARQVGPGSLYLVSNLKTWIETGHGIGE